MKNSIVVCTCALLLALGCSASTKTPICGNGILEPGELCDDGNYASGDGCSSTCVPEYSCGNGICEVGENETNCPSDCTSGCGNGTCEYGETPEDCPSDCPPDCPVPNSCGGCAPLPAEPGGACGDCGVYACDGLYDVVCNDPGANSCGGCVSLTAEPGDECGDCGTFACDGTEALTCDDPGFNGCGGCSTLPDEPGDPCGECGAYVCDGTDAVTCDDPGTNACGGCATLPADPGDECGDCGTYACDGTDALVCEEPPSCCDWSAQILPSSADGSGCGTDDHFNFSACGEWKIYDVTPGYWLRVEARGDSCGSCLLWHIDFDIQESVSGTWTTVESHDPEPDERGMRYHTSFLPTGSQIRIHSTSGFYVRLYQTGITNGGLETGSLTPMTSTSGHQTPSITTDATFVAGRGATSFGAAYTGAIISGSDSRYWGISVPLDCPFTIATDSQLTFDTYGASYQAYAHHHVTLTFDDGSSTSYDSYVDFSAGIPSGWSLQTVDIATGSVGRIIASIDISFHKDHSTYTRYSPSIFIDNVTLR